MPSSLSPPTKVVVTSNRAAPVPDSVDREETSQTPRHPAKTQGLNIEQVPVLVNRYRSDAARSRLLADRSVDSFDQALDPILPKESILCSDDAPSIVASKHGSASEKASQPNICPNT